MVDMTAPLFKRYYCNCVGDYCYQCSTWNDWGRWVALGAIVIGIVFVALVFSCINNRRRRRRGAAPMYGTGWVPYQGKPAQGQQNFYPAPPYSPPVGNQATGNTYNSNDGYYGQPQYGQQPYGQQQYGQQQHGIELQQPQSSYQPQANRGGEHVYEAPLGAPPGKGDGIIR